LLEISEIGNNLFKERFQTIPGVSGVSIWGEKRYSMKLIMDPAQNDWHWVSTPVDIRNALTECKCRIAIWEDWKETILN
jgi:multidrug efflux pump